MSELRRDFGAEIFLCPSSQLTVQQSARVSEDGLVSVIVLLNNKLMPFPMNEKNKSQREVS